MWDIPIYFIGIVAAGGALDLWMTHGQKRTLHDRMTRWFIALDSWEIPQYPKKMAEFVLGLERRVAKGKRWRFFLASVVTSFALTTAALVLGIGLENAWPTPGLATILEIPIPILLGYYTINYIFDFSTIVFTLVIIKKLSMSVVCNALWILFDLILSFFIFNLCYIFLSLFSSYFVIPLEIQVEILALYGMKEDYTIGHSIILYCGTTFFPTLFYFIILYLMMALRGMMTLGKKFSLQWFEVATQHIPEEGKVATGEKFKPWTMLAVAAGLLVVVFKFLKALVAGE